MNSRCTGVILAGGSSRRFSGLEKGLLGLGGRCVVDWAIEALRPATDELLLIANESAVRAHRSDIPVRSDVRPERGSLIGLHSALTYCSDGALIIAWDMPFLSSSFLLALRERGERAGIAVIPQGPRGVEPLCAYYPKYCMNVVERQLALGEMRLSAFVDALEDAAILSLDEVRRFGEPERLFANLNTPDDFRAAESLLERSRATPELASHRHSQ